MNAYIAIVLGVFLMIASGTILYCLKGMGKD